MNIFKQVASFKTKDDYINFLKDETQIYCDEMQTLSRPEHVACVYLLGKNLFIKLYGELLIPAPEGLCINFQLIWKYLSIFHDIGYGYQSHNPFDDPYNSNRLKLLYLGYVLDVDDRVNSNWAAAYSVEEMMAYYNYIYQKRTNLNLQEKRNIFETHEHGILGGAITSLIMQKNVPVTMKNSQNSWYYITLASALAIAQHNIWPVSKKDIKKYSTYFEAYGVDKKKFYKRHYHLDQHIDLLSFYICLIDSIEFVKRLYKSNSEYPYRVANKILANYRVNVVLRNSAAVIRIYTRRIENICKKYRKLSAFKKWRKSLINMPLFLKLNIKEKKNGIIDIAIVDNSFGRKANN